MLGQYAPITEDELEHQEFSSDPISWLRNVTLPHWTKNGKIC